MYGAFFEGLAEAAASVSPLDPYETRHIVNVLFALAALVAAGVHGPAPGRDRGRRARRPDAGPDAAVLRPRLQQPEGHPLRGHLRGGGLRDPGSSAIAARACAGATSSRPRWPSASPRACAWPGSRCSVSRSCSGARWPSCEPARGRGRTAGSGDARRLALSWLAVVLLGWTVMVVLWPWAQVAPIRNPLRALGAFSRFWETMVVFYDGEYVPNGAVSRFYIPKWFALTMPETYAVAAVLGLLQPGPPVAAAGVAGGDARRASCRPGGSPWWRSCPWPGWSRGTRRCTTACAISCSSCRCWPCWRACRPPRTCARASGGAGRGRRGRASLAGTRRPDPLRHDRPASLRGALLQPRWWREGWAGRSRGTTRTTGA